ncbi:MAG: tRNA pseudouridine(38-40) synthase TruA [Thermoleophilia bacterium]|nr:tRNA pseudouridine(38-40) synthase TruA [Thermoleophilia bacterium]
MDKLRNIRLDLEYDGAGFAGWAKQPGLPTIEGALEEALGRILQEEVGLSVAGRTDAGVHARGQVASLRVAGPVEPDRLMRSANKLLPEGVVITGAVEAPPGFDARRSALSRTYSYSVLNRPFPSAFQARYSFYYPGTLDKQLLRDAAALVLGHHDFTAFTPTVTEHGFFEREIVLSEWRMEGELLVYWIGSSSFLRNMVRVIVGTMLEVGRGYRPLDELRSLLLGAGRPAAGVTAPPRGLCLEAVGYPGTRP